MERVGFVQSQLTDAYKNISEKLEPSHLSSVAIGNNISMIRRSKRLMFFVILILPAVYFQHFFHGLIAIVDR